jgi:hypothetical protein
MVKSQKSFEHETKMEMLKTKIEKGDTEKKGSREIEERVPLRKTGTEEEI